LRKRDPAIGLHLPNPPLPRQALEVLGHAAPLHGFGNRHVVLCPVDEAVRGDLPERVRFAEKLQQARLARTDHCGETVEPLQERASILEKTNVVEGRIEAGLERRRRAQGGFEVV